MYIYIYMLYINNINNNTYIYEYKYTIYIRGSKYITYKKMWSYVESFQCNKQKQFVWLLSFLCCCCFLFVFHCLKAGIHVFVGERKKVRVIFFFSIWKPQYVLCTDLILHRPFSPFLITIWISIPPVSWLINVFTINEIILNTVFVSDYDYLSL